MLDAGRSVDKSAVTLLGLGRKPFGAAAFSGNRARAGVRGTAGNSARAGFGCGGTSLGHLGRLASRIRFALRRGGFVFRRLALGGFGFGLGRFHEKFAFQQTSAGFPNFLETPFEDFQGASHRIGDLDVLQVALGEFLKEEGFAPRFLAHPDRSLDVKRTHPQDQIRLADHLGRQLAGTVTGQIHLIGGHDLNGLLTGAQSGYRHYSRRADFDVGNLKVVQHFPKIRRRHRGAASVASAQKKDDFFSVAGTAPKR